MFHRETFKNLLNKPIHEFLFYVFLFCLPFQTRIIYSPGSAYIEWYFNYHLALFVYLTDILLVSCFIMWFLFDRPWKVTNRTSEFASEAKQSTLWFRLLRRPMASSQIRLICLILAFFGLILVSLFHVKHLDFGLYQAFKWLELLLLLLYLKTTFRETKQFVIAAWIIFASAIFQALIGLWQFHVQHMLGLGWLGEYIAPWGTSGLATIDTATGKIIRAYGTMPHPNILGVFLVFGLFMAFFLVSRETFPKPHPRESGDLKKALSRSRIALTAFVASGMVIILLGIFVTFSRLTWLAAGIGYFAFIMYYLWHKQRQKVLILAIIGLVSCLSAVALAKADGTLLQNLLKARIFDSGQTALADRGFFDHLGLTLVSHHPVFGIGVGNYVPALQDLVKLHAWQYQPAHNIFIFIAAELGIVGLIIFLWLLWKIFRGLKNISHGPLLFTVYCLLFTFLFLGQFDHYFVTIQQGRLILFTLLGLISALPNLQHESPKIKIQSPNENF